MPDIMVMLSRSRSIATSTILIAVAILIALTNCHKKKATEPTPVLPGENWTVRVTGGLYDFRDITTDGSILVAVGDSGRILTSSDSGATWTLRTSPTRADLSSVTYSETFGFVAVTSSDGGDTVINSSDGIAWTAPPTSGITVELSGVASDSASLIAVGCSGSIFRSISGIAWDPRVSGGPCVRAVERTHIGSSEFIAVGDSGRINASFNGVGWPSVASGVTNNLRGLSSGCAKVVIVGDGGIIKVSTNGSTWTTADSVRTGLNAVACGDDTFIAVGKSGSVYTSHDNAVTWIKRNSQTTKELCGICRVGSRYIAVGLDGTIITSF